MLDAEAGSGSKGVRGLALTHLPLYMKIFIYFAEGVSDKNYPKNELMLDVRRVRSQMTSDI